MHLMLVMEKCSDFGKSNLAILDLMELDAVAADLRCWHLIQVLVHTIFFAPLIDIDCLSEPQPKAIS